MCCRFYKFISLEECCYRSQWKKKTAYLSNSKLPKLDEMEKNVSFGYHGPTTDKYMGYPFAAESDLSFKGDWATWIVFSCIYQISRNSPISY